MGRPLSEIFVVKIPDKRLLYLEIYSHDSLKFLLDMEILNKELSKNAS